MLADAVARHHPGERLVVLVADDVVSRGPAGARGDAGAGGGGRAPFVRLAATEIGLEPSVLHELALCRSGDDLAACLVPALLAHLLETGRPVVALSPGVVLLAPLDDFARRSLDSGLVLVPRSLRALPEDGRRPSASDAVARGAFTPSIVAAGPAGRRALDWWAQALRAAAADAGASPAAAQPALGLLAQQFGAAVERDPGVGLGAWNAHERELTRSPDGGLLASGSPVTLVDLDGFDPATPHLLAPRYPRPRVLLSEVSELARLCAERVAALARLEPPGTPPGAPRPCAADEDSVLLGDGTPLDERMRRLARRALARDGAERPPDPFDPEGAARFHEWLASPDALDAEAASIPRYLVAVREERRDLLWHFPRVETVDRAHFQEWVANHGLDEARVPPALRAALARTSFWSAPTGVVASSPAALRPGVVLAGYLRAESGVGEAARLAHDAMVASGIDVVPAVLGLTPSRQRHPFGAGDEVPVADRTVNLLWTSADQLPGFASVVGPDFFEGRYTIGYWAWETEELPASMAASATMLDEVWVPSRYVQAAVAPAVDRPVAVFPHPVVAPALDERFDASALGIPSGFRFLFTYDFLSGFARKNPLGLLEAFDSAFAPGEGPVLVLKSVNGERRLEELERLRIAARGRPDVVVLDGYLTAGERAALLASCDCFVSLHRSEGFGLGLAEAMALGKPVIATAYSGNLDFMDGSSALLVPARRVEVGAGAAPYEPDAHWGEPDLGVAAQHMRRVAGDPGAARELGARGRARVLEHHGAARAGDFAARRLGEIGEALRRGYVSRAPDAVRRLR